MINYLNLHLKFIKELLLFARNEHGGWSSVEGTWWSKWGKLFPYFKEEISIEELKKPTPKPKAKEQNSEMAIVLAGEGDWKDYSVELKLRPDYNQAKLGIAVRYNPEDGSGYYLWIEQIKQKKPKLPLNFTITLEKKVRGKSELLSDTIYTNSLRWFIIEIVVDGEKIEVSVDGKKVIKVKDSEIQKGQIALITEQRLPLTVIDDFVVRPIGKKGIFSKKQNGKEIQAKAQSEITLNPSSNFKAIDYQTLNEYRNKVRGPNSEILELNELSNSSTPEPVLHVLSFSPISHFSPEPDPLYQTTSSLPPSELVYYYHHDHLGNIRAVTDQNKTVVERHDFYPFGEEITTPQSKDQYLFTGKPRDSETGLDYFGKRYYSSSLCRWMSTDPKENTRKYLKRNLENPQLWNLFNYCGNNPLSFFDPDGQASFHIKVKNLEWVPYKSPQLQGYGFGRTTGAQGEWLQLNISYKEGKFTIDATVFVDIYIADPSDTVWALHPSAILFQRTPLNVLDHELNHLIDIESYVKNKLNELENKLNQANNKDASLLLTEKDFKSLIEEYVKDARNYSRWLRDSDWSIYSYLEILKNWFTSPYIY